MMHSQTRDILRDLVSIDRTLKYQEAATGERLHCIGDESGRTLELLVMSMAPRTIIEVGTGVGYSTMWLAEGARRTGAHVITIETDKAKRDAAIRFAECVDLSDIITFVEGDALHELATRDLADLYLIDAAKHDYVAYVEAVLKISDKRRFTLLADNMISHRSALADFVSYLDRERRLSHVLLPVGKGLELVVANG